MKKILALIILMSISSWAMAQTKTFIDQPYIETAAKADTLVTPDKIYLSIFISEKDTKGRKTVEELEQLMVARLKSIGVNLKEQLVLSDLSSNFKKYFLRKQDILKSKSFQLTVYDANTAARVMYEMEDIGISNINIQKTEYSKMEELKLNLLSKAMKKAKKQAEAMVKPLNQSVGNAIFISDMQTNRSLMGRANGILVRGYSSAKKEYEPLPIEFEKIKVETHVEVKFVIKGKTSL